MRNPVRESRAFLAADALAERAWRMVGSLAPEDRRDLGSQLRRAALSVACNLLEGGSRRSARERLRFVEIADGSLREAGYLIEFAARCRVLDPRAIEDMSALHRTATDAIGRRRRNASGRLSRRERLRHRDVAQPLAPAAAGG